MAAKAPIEMWFDRVTTLIFVVAQRIDFGIRDFEILIGENMDIATLATETSKNIIITVESAEFIRLLKLADRVSGDRLWGVDLVRFSLATASSRS